MLNRFKEKTQGILNNQIKLEVELTKKVEELYDIEVNKTIRADYQQQLKKDEKDLDLLLGQLASPGSKTIEIVKMLELQAEEKAENIRLLEKGMGSFNVLMLPFILKSRTKRNVDNRDKEISKLDSMFMELFHRQLRRIKFVENKWPGINKKNGNDFNIFLMSEPGTLQTAINQLS